VTGWFYAGKDLSYMDMGVMISAVIFHGGTEVSLLKGRHVKATKLIQLVSQYFVTANYSIRRTW